jgi:acyl carrier protein
MNRNDVLEAFRSAAVEVLAVDPALIREDASLVRDLEADSLDIVEVVMLVEEKLDMSIPEEIWEDVENIGAAIDKILDLDTAGASA